jgi:hypothetical protein
LKVEVTAVEFPDDLLAIAADRTDHVPVEIRNRLRADAPAGKAG